MGSDRHCRQLTVRYCPYLHHVSTLDGQLTADLALRLQEAAIVLVPHMTQEHHTGSLKRRPHINQKTHLVLGGAIVKSYLIQVSTVVMQWCS